MYQSGTVTYSLITKAVETRPLLQLLDRDTHMKQILKRLVQEDSGQDMIEYVLVSTLLALSVLAVIRAYNVNIQGTLNGLGSALTKSISP